MQQFEVFLVSLDPTKGYEINKTRPCIIVSPNELNRQVKTVIIAPMTTKTRPYATRIPVNFLDKDGHVVLDQMRTVDKSRLLKKMGKITLIESRRVLTTLQELFR